MIFICLFIFYIKKARTYFWLICQCRLSHCPNHQINRSGTHLYNKVRTATCLVWMIQFNLRDLHRSNQQRDVNHMFLPSMSCRCSNSDGVGRLCKSTKVIWDCQTFPYKTSEKPLLLKDLCRTTALPFVISSAKICKLWERKKEKDKCQKNVEFFNVFLVDESTYLFRCFKNQG